MKKIFLFLTVFLTMATIMFWEFNFTSAIIPNIFAAETVANESQIRLVQQRLKDWGYYDGPVTGYYGELTKAAVIKFQRKHGLNAAGYLGPLTLEKIGIYVQTPSSSVVGSTPYGADVIKKVQQRLLDWGYYDGPVTGYYGKLTTAGVIKFQKKHGLNAEGYLGPLTLEKIGICVYESGSTQSNSDLELLARCVYGESRGEPYEGQVAVAAVILNRVEHQDFTNRNSEIIYQAWAFTVVKDGQISLSPDQQTYNACRDALNGWDPSYGCLFYYNPEIATSQWMFQKPVVTKIGSHVFCY